MLLMFIKYLYQIKTQVHYHKNNGSKIHLNSDNIVAYQNTDLISLKDLSWYHKDITHCTMLADSKSNLTRWVSIRYILCMRLVFPTLLMQHEVCEYLQAGKIKQGKSEGFDSCDRPSDLKWYSNCQFVSLCDLEIWWMTSKNNRALLLYYVKLYASFQIHHMWIQTGVTVWKRSIRVEIGNILFHVTLKFDGWHWKAIGHLSYATSSFVHSFIAISEFKLELQSENTHFG